MIRHPPIPAQRKIRHRRQQIRRKHFSQNLRRRRLTRYGRVVHPRYGNVGRDLEPQELRPGIVVGEEDLCQEGLAGDGGAEVRPGGGDVLGAVVAVYVDVDGCVELLECWMEDGEVSERHQMYVCARLKRCTHPRC